MQRIKSLAIVEFNEWHFSLTLFRLWMHSSLLSDKAFTVILIRHRSRATFLLLFKLQPIAKWNSCSDGEKIQREIAGWVKEMLCSTTFQVTWATMCRKWPNFTFSTVFTRLVGHYASLYCSCHDFRRIFTALIAKRRFTHDLAHISVVLWPLKPHQLMNSHSFTVNHQRNKAHVRRNSCICFRIALLAITH